MSLWYKRDGVATNQSTVSRCIWTNESASLFPKALVLNLLGWLALLLLFLVIRKNVFNLLSQGLQRNLGRVTEVDQSTRGLPLMACNMDAIEP